jgi:hypothetical protein
MTTACCSSIHRLRCFSNLNDCKAAAASDQSNAVWQIKSTSRRVLLCSYSPAIRINSFRDETGVSSR